MDADSKLVATLSSALALALTPIPGLAPGPAAAPAVAAGRGSGDRDFPSLPTEPGPFFLPREDVRGDRPRPSPSSPTNGTQHVPKGGEWEDTLRRHTAVNLGNGSMPCTGSSKGVTYGASPQAFRCHSRRLAVV